jgi:hypothetical protein
VKAAPARLPAVTFGPLRSWRTQRKWQTTAGVGSVSKSNKTVTILSLPVRKKMEKGVDGFAILSKRRQTKTKNISLKSIHEKEIHFTIRLL